MLYTIDNYIFDSERLVLYSRNIEKKEKEAIENLIKSYDEDYANVRKKLFAQNPHHMNVNKFVFDSCGIIPTYNCNLRCQYCAYSSGNSEKRAEVTLDEAKIFLKDIIRRKSIQRFAEGTNVPLHIDFTGGGEPTYNWGLLKQIVMFAKEECTKNKVTYTFGMTTNGVLSEEQILFIKANFSKLMISYDGLPEIHNKNRRNDIGNKFSDIVERSIQQLSCCDIELTVRTTIWQQDIQLVNKMYQYIYDIIPTNGKIIWSIYPTENEGRALDNEYQYDMLMVEKLLEFYMNKSGEIASQDKGKIIKIELPIFVNNLCEIFCGGTLITSPWLLPGGEIVTCVESMGGKVVIGNVESAEVNYSKPYYDKLLEITQKKYDECRNCIAYAYCKGGCPMWHIREPIDGKEAQECYLQKLYLEKIIKALIEDNYSFEWQLEKLTISGVATDIYKLVYKRSH